jgi:prepilin-type N-terminal cleavage/methylation domain-containing protein
VTKLYLRFQYDGFTLTELAMVLVIVALLIGGMITPLSTQRDIQSANDAQKQLSEIKEALLGFAVINGRLPCPATAGTTGIESLVSAGVCTTPYAGFVPAITLGIAPTNAQGYVIDSWGNPIRYALSNATVNTITNVFSTAGRLKAAWAIDPSKMAPDLLVCNTSLGITGSGGGTNCASGTSLINDAVAIITSTGKNGGVAPTGADELANQNNDRTFISHAQSPSGAPQGEFDDIVAWLSPNILFSRMIAAGRFP